MVPVIPEVTIASPANGRTAMATFASATVHHPLVSALGGRAEACLICVCAAPIVGDS